MDQNSRLTIFRAQTENVRELKKARCHITKSINFALRKNDQMSANMHTKVLALMYCAWAEASFSKLIHTPYGLELDEIEQIRRLHARQGVGPAWKKCLELGLSKISSRGNSGYIPNITQRIERIIDDYVIEPTLLRNKVAHGQWRNALNRENTAFNPELSKLLGTLDVVAVERWYKAQEILIDIIEMLIESPTRAFHRDYWRQICRLEERLTKRESWTLETKIIRLMKKPIIHKAKEVVS